MKYLIFILHKYYKNKQLENDDINDYIKSYLVLLSFSLLCFIILLCDIEFDFTLEGRPKYITAIILAIIGYILIGKIFNKKLKNEKFVNEIYAKYANNKQHISFWIILLIPFFLIFIIPIIKISLKYLL